MGQISRPAFDEKCCAATHGGAELKPLCDAPGTYVLEG